MAGAWPLVGRGDELRRLTAALGADAHAGAVLTGPAGVGKTRLAREIVSVAEHRGMATEWVVATESSATIPLGAFAHLLPARDGASSDLLSLVRDIRAVLTERAAGRALVVGVDDAQHLDAASATLVHQLAASRAAFVLATVRSRAATPDAVAALWRGDLALRLELDTLTEDHVAGLLGAVLGGQVEGLTVRQLSQLCGGNPLFLREFLIAGLEAGNLDERSGIWTWRGDVVPGTRLQEVVEERLSRLSPQEREVLEIVAVGEPLGIEAFERLGVGIEVVDRLERSELLEIRRDLRREQAWLVHPLHGEVLRASTPVLRARWIRSTLADLVEAQGMHRQGDLLRVAAWRLDGGGADPAMLVEAAHHAEGAFDFAMAERFALAAVTAGGGREARFTLATALRAQGRSEEAEEVFADLAREADDVDWRLEVAYARSMNLFFGLGRSDRAIAVLDEAARVSPPERRHEIAGQRAMFDLYRGRPSDAVRGAVEVFASPAAGTADVANATVAAAAAWAIGGETKRAVDAVDRVFFDALALPVVGNYVAGLLLASRYLAMVLAGDLEGAFELASRTYAQAVDMGAHDGIAAMAAAMGQSRLLQGRLEDGIEHLSEAAVLLREQDRNGYLPWCLGSLAAAHAQRGELRSAEVVLAEVDAATRGDLRLFDVEVEIGRAWVTALQGRPSRAVDLLAAAALDAEERGAVLFAATALHEAVRLGAAARVAGDLARIATVADSDLAALYARHAECAAAGDGRALEAVSVAFEETGASLLAAEAAAEAADAHRRAGGTGNAYAASDRARALAERCQGAATPALDLADEPLPLTPREREVALLAARGLASKEIAERLYLSVRTVDNHLHRSYAKLGVSSRQELVHVLGSALPPGPRD